ncbi:MAG: hypothetical protein HON63_01310 [Rhodobacteraceae bacterium]|nr:hypothetical protein [Paracoccaceae bacterium]
MPTSAVSCAEVLKSEKRPLHNPAAKPKALCPVATPGCACLPARPAQP